VVEVQQACQGRGKELVLQSLRKLLQQQHDANQRVSDFRVTSLALEARRRTREEARNTVLTSHSFV
jgi:hypothetical protein